MTDRAAFLAARKSGIGGSDVAALYSLDYSCRRHLFYDKSGQAEDFPREETKAMRLGTFMEEFFADEYSASTGRAVWSLPEPLSTGGVLCVNVDRMVAGKDAEFSGVLEIKSMGREMFYKTKREGLSRSYILQLQAGMIAANATRGSFAIGSRDSGDLIHFDVERDEALCKAIPDDAAAFWAQLQSGDIPDRLEPDDRRCQKCEYRVTCQGNALVQLEGDGEVVPAPDLLPLVSEKIDRDALYDQALALCNETDEELRSALGDRQAVVVGDAKLYHRPQAGKVLYKGKELLGAYKKLMGDYLEAWESFPAKEMGPLTFPDPDTLPKPESFIDHAKPSRPLRLYPGRKK